MGLDDVVAEEERLVERRTAATEADERALIARQPTSQPRDTRR